MEQFTLGTAGDTSSSMEDYRDLAKRRRRKSQVKTRAVETRALATSTVATPDDRPGNYKDLLSSYLFHYLILMTVFIFLVLLIFGWNKGWNL